MCHDTWNPGLAWSIPESEHALIAKCNRCLLGLQSWMIDNPVPAGSILQPFVLPLLNWLNHVGERRLIPHFPFLFYVPSSLQ